MRFLSFISTIAYGIVTLMLTVVPTVLNVGTLSWVAEWWGVVTAAYLFLNALPIAWILLFKENRKASWQWKFDHADTTSSYVLVLKVLVIIPIINAVVPGDMLYWQYKIWLISAFAAGVDLLLALIENQCEKNALA